MRSFVRFAVVALAAAPLLGCVPESIQDKNPLAFFYYLFGAGVVAKAPRPEKHNGTMDFDIVAQVDGVPTGGYDVTLYRSDDEVAYGHFSGTTKIKRQRYITIKDTGSTDLKDMVAAIVSDTLGGESVSITKAKAIVNAHETPGGVKAIFTAKITFSGLVTSGADNGRKIKKGKLTSKATYPKQQM